MTSPINHHVNNAEHYVIWCCKYSLLLHSFAIRLQPWQSMTPSQCTQLTLAPGKISTSLIISLNVWKYWLAMPWFIQPSGAALKWSDKWLYTLLPYWRHYEWSNKNVPLGNWGLRLSNEISCFDSTSHLVHRNIWLGHFSWVTLGRMLWSQLTRTCRTVLRVLIHYRHVRVDVLCIKESHTSTAEHNSLSLTIL
jgi:hypothetical protein